jgi:hypothetical protein
MNTSKYILYVGEGDEVSAEDLMSEIKAAAQGSFVQFRPTTKEDILSMDNPDEFFDLQDNDWEDCLDMYITMIKQI